jgi:uncharacterized membrane protein
MILLAPKSLALLLLVVAAALLLFYGLLLRREGRHDHRLSRLQVLMLWILRGSAALAALAALARPAYEEVRVQQRLPVVTLLVDESRSMEFPDSRDSALVRSHSSGQLSRYRSAALAVDELQQKLSLTHRVRVYTFSDSLKLLRELPHRERQDEPALTSAEIFAAHDAPTGDYSNLGDALEDVLRDLAGEKVAGVVLLSDGRQTGGAGLDGAAELASAAHVPVHAVVLGTEFPLLDLRIDDVIAGAEASLGDVLTFHVKVTNQVSSALDVELTLEERPGDDPVSGGGSDNAASAYQQVARRQLRLARGEQSVTISTIPDTEGLRRFRLSLPQQPDEVNTDNNVAEISVNIVKRTLKVLLVAGDPSREYFYLVPALLRDPIIDLSCFLQSADVDYMQQGNSAIERLPATVKEWSAYDVAILLDVDPNGITTQQLSGLENMVSNGGGLMIIAGRTHGLAKLVQVHAAQIRGLLPVEVDKNLHLDHDRVHSQAFHILRTVPGRSHPIAQASADPTVNEQLWSTFERLDFFWHHPVSGPKPKAIVLAERGGAAGGPSEPLMVVHRYVDGAVFFSAINDLWRWRYPYESYECDRLWTRMIRYLGEARLLGTQQQVALATDRRSYGPGEDVEIVLRVLDPALMAQLSGQPLFASVGGTGQDQYAVPLSPDVRGEPLYRGSYRARHAGSMMIRARHVPPDADSEAKPLFDVSHSFEVKMQSLEAIDTSADLAGMQRLAEQTGGRYFDYHTMNELASLADEIPPDPQVLTEVTVREVWDGTLFLTIFLVLVSSELSLRKWWGLL